MAAFQSQYGVQWHPLLAGSVIAALPILVIYLAGPERFGRGITPTGMGEQ